MGKNLSSFKGTGKAGIAPIQLYYQAGINPKTGEPTRLMGDSQLYTEQLRLLRIMDEQDFVNRFKWENIPANIPSRELERLLYYKGHIILFKWKNEFYFMPYALDGSIDFYGRYNRVHPVPMTSGKDDEKKEEFKNLEALLSEIKLKPIYTLKQLEEVEESEEECCVIFRDYTPQLSWTNLPRWQLIDSTLQLESETFCYLSLAMLTASGVKGMRVPDVNAKAEANSAARSMKSNAMNGSPWVSIVSPIEFQDLTDGPTAKIQEYFLSLQSIDNFRLTSLGLDNVGVFEKQAHTLESENAVNTEKTSLIMTDGLTIREESVEIANKLFKLNMSVKKAEAIADTLGEGVDPMNFNKTTYVNNQPEGGENDELL